MTIESLQEQIKILNQIIKIKDDIIADKDLQIEKLEKKVSIGYGAMGEILKVYKDHEKNISKV